jgi:wyosine [tRNA(Phe)-imidazoG37] synthetase (radical SAM superfamily)
MSKKNYKYVYGPVSSWRLGSSLGVDPISEDKKYCSFDCIYCQLGRTNFLSDERRNFVSTLDLIREFETLPAIEIDYITFSGTGEPTLAKNLGEMINAVRQIRKEKIAVLTNSSLLNKYDVREDLMLADFVSAKLDAPSQEIFEIVNRPLNTIKFDNVLQAIKDFRSIFKGKFALQIMFLKENIEYVSEIAKIAKEINPDEVQINTPLRPCKAKPLLKEELDRVKSYFDGLNAIYVYNASKKEVKPISDEKTLLRRGKID